MENGQYNEGWADIHIMPEDGVKAHKDLRGNYMMPIHWGSFKLSIHDWWEPVERAVAEAEKQNVKILTPRVGQTLKMIPADNDSLTAEFVPETEAWWKEYK
jgi:L-ascorbate metabolism protein UlaG (beta-lactamase superfamily)